MPGRRFADWPEREGSMGDDRPFRPRRRRPAPSRDHDRLRPTPRATSTRSLSAPVARRCCTTTTSCRSCSTSTASACPSASSTSKGAGAHGFFEVTADVTQLTKASFLVQIGKRTPVFACFSIVAGEQGYPDTVRDPRGFALKLYTDEGNYDRPATTRRSSSSATHRSFRTSFTPRSARRTPGCARTTCSGTSGRCLPRAPTRWRS